LLCFDRKIVLQMALLNFVGLNWNFSYDDRTNITKTHNSIFFFNYLCYIFH
jgi:hypothetical protein